MSPTDIPTPDIQPAPEAETVVVPKPSRIKKYTKFTLLYVVLPASIGTTAYFATKLMDKGVKIEIETPALPLPE